MKKLRDAVPTEHQDSFLRVYPRVLADKDLNLLQKLILSDILSYQLRGQSYFKSSSDVGEYLGGYKVKTIQSAFQQLAKLGYITTMIKEGNKKNYTLRYASVVDMEFWVQNEDFLQGRERKTLITLTNEIEVLPPQKEQSKKSYTLDDAIAIVARNQHMDINDKPMEIEGLLFVPNNFITNNFGVRERLIQSEKQGKKLIFIEAAITYSGEIISITKVTKVIQDGEEMFMKESYIR